LIKRLSGRWTCRAEGHVYHTEFHPPKVAGRCDEDGSELYQRDDDREETVRNRIQVYTTQTAPLIDYYKGAGLLVEIDGAQPNRSCDVGFGGCYQEGDPNDVMGSADND